MDTMLFKPKGMPPSASAVGGPPMGGAPMDAPPMGEPVTVACPACGCEFDPASPESYQPPGDPMAGAAGGGIDLSALTGAPQ